MKFTLEQREYLDDLIDQQESGTFSRTEVIDTFTDYLRELASEDGLGELLAGLSAAAVTERLGKRAWRAEPDAQMALFDGNAVLALGDDEYILMRDARAAHMDRHRTILDTNFRRVAGQYTAKTAYINKRMPVLRASGLTLGEVEEDLGWPEAA